MEDLKEFSLGIGKEFIPFFDTKEDQVDNESQEEPDNEEDYQFKASTASFESLLNQKEGEMDEETEKGYSASKDHINDVTELSSYSKELVQDQISKIKSLEQELLSGKQNNYSEIPSSEEYHIKDKSSLLKTYKDQNENYKSQIRSLTRLLEEQKTFYTRMTQDASKSESENLTQIANLMSTLHNMTNENSFLRNQCGELERRCCQKDEELSLQAQTLRRKAKELKDIKSSETGKMESINKKINKVKQRSDEQESKIISINKSKKSLQAQLAQCKSELSDRIQEFNTVKEKEISLIEKLRKEIEKLKKDNKELLAKNDKLREDKDRREAMQKRVSECAVKMEKINKEIDLERKKSSRLTKENTGYKKEIDVLKEKIKGENHPDSLKAKIHDQSTRIANLRKDNSSKAKEISSLVSKVEKANFDIKQISDYLTSEYKCLSTWIESCLNSKYVFSISNSSKNPEKYSLPKCIDFPKIIDQKPDILKEKSKFCKISGIPKQLESLKKLLRKSQVEIIESAAKIIEDNATLQENIRETNQFKSEISKDFENLKMSLITTEKSITHLNSEKDDLVDETQKWKEKFTAVENQYKNISSEYDRVLLDILFSLETARKRYENTENLKESTSDFISDPLLAKIQKNLESPSSEDGLKRSDRKAGIIKYIGCFDQIIISLAGDLSQSDQTLQKIPQLQNQVKETTKQLEQAEVDFANEREALEKAHFEENTLKAQEMESLNGNYQNKIRLMQEELSAQEELVQSKCEEIASLSSDLSQLTKQIHSQIDLSKDLKQLATAGHQKVTSLVFQKGVLKDQLHELQQSYKKTTSFLERVYCKIREINLGVQGEEVTNKDKEIKTVSPLFKFRKSVLAIIAVNRIKKLFKTQCLGKYDLECIDSIKVAEFGENEEMFISQGYQLPEYDTEDNQKCFKFENNSIEKSLSITPIKPSQDESCCKNLKTSFQNPSVSSNSHYKSSLSLKRPCASSDLFPYISKPNASCTFAKTGLGETTAQKSPYYTALIRQLDLALKTLFSTTKSAKKQLKSSQSKASSLETKISTLEEELLESMQKCDGFQEKLNKDVKKQEELGEKLVQSEHKIEQLKVRIQDLQALNENIEDKKCRLSKEVVKSEIKIKHLQREIEMKDMQIENLKTLCVKNEQDFEQVNGNWTDMMHKLKKMEFEKSKLVSDNVKLLNENEGLRKELLNVTFRQDSSQEYSSVQTDYKHQPMHNYPSQNKENINQNIQHDPSENSPTSYRRKRTAHFPNIKPEVYENSEKYHGGDSRRGRERNREVFGHEVESEEFNQTSSKYDDYGNSPPEYPPKTYSYLNSNADQNSPQNSSPITTPQKSESEFEFCASLKDSSHSPPELQ
ncbi:unnamed protein product [Moneuplotes crassus]|uniref:Pericentrin/AKAP-450 centrosomal targeting domain-containing protein n=1 Tax=Euplotes crassus TaxID=5936 RepID=A0AAD1U329_EUPCR|nr:unnamed protein product [Moneuplotes crassus]